MVYVWSAVGGSPAVVSIEVLWFDGPTAALVLAVAVIFAATVVLLAGLAGRRAIEEMSPFPGEPALAWSEEPEPEDEVLAHW